MEAAGAKLTSWLQVLLELQRDWTRRETYEEREPSWKTTLAVTGWVWFTLAICCIRPSRALTL
jgi:hypothetical protein